MGKYSQLNEEEIIESYFDKNYIGNCIDIGAYDGIGASNTLYFEERGWYCLCIEPNPNSFKYLKQNRKYTVNYAISDVNDDLVFNVARIKDSYLHEDAISSLKIDERLLKQHQDAGYEINVYSIMVEVITLDKCIEDFYKKDTIDFINIDTEGTELDVLKGFNINKWKLKLFIIENNFNESLIEEYLIKYGYKKDKRIGVNDFYII